MDVHGAQTDCQVLGIDDDIGKRSRTEQHDDPVIPRDVVYALGALLHRVGHIADQHERADEQRVALQVEVRKEQRVDDDPQRERRHDAEHDVLRHAVPHADIGLAVIFLHDLIDRGGIEIEILVEHGGVDRFRGDAAGAKFFGFLQFRHS